MSRSRSCFAQPKACCLVIEWIDLTCSYEGAVRGATFVFHTASPFVLKVPRGAERELLIEPAVKGTENIIGTGSPPVQRLIQGLWAETHNRRLVL